MTETAGDLQTMLTTLRAARATGARRIEVRAAGGHRIVEYKGDAEMASAIADLERRIAALQRPQIRTIRIHSSKGAI